MANSEKKSVLQAKFFARIKNTLSAHQSLVDVVGDLLNLGDDASYRRIRGTILLDFEETVKLCQHFKISLDSIIGASNQNMLLCQYAPQRLRNIEEFVKYVQIIAENMERFRLIPGTELLLSATDVPVFNYVSHRELTLFYIFSWQKNLLGFSDGFDEFLQQFDVEGFVRWCEMIKRNYELIPSSEIWTSNTLEPYLRMISYHYKIGHFSNEKIPLLLCEQLMDMMNNLQIWLEKGKKGADETPFKFYISEIDIGNTFFLFKNKKISVSMLRLYMINGLSISGENFGNEIEIWLNNLIKHSTLISGTSDIERHKFFNAQRQKIENLMQSLTV